MWGGTGKIKKEGGKGNVEGTQEDRGLSLLPGSKREREREGEANK